MAHWMLALVAIPLAACNAAVSGGEQDDGAPGVAAQGSGGTRTYAVADFTTVALRGSDDVDVRVGPGFSVRADGDPEVLDRLKISKDGDTIRIGRIRSEGWSNGGRSARISITMPRIVAAAVAGSGDVRVDRVEGASFEANNAGSGSLKVGQLQVNEARLSLAGSGDMELAGYARSLTVNIAGSGDVDAGGLRADQANVSIAGSGGVRAAVKGPAKVSIVGSGDADLGGEAKCQVSKMGSGSARCGG